MNTRYIRGPSQFSTAQTSLEMLKEMDEAAAFCRQPEEDKVIVNDRITAYIQSLDAGNGPLLDSIEEEALADCVPIIRRETSAFLKTLIALKRRSRFWR